MKKMHLRNWFIALATPLAVTLLLFMAVPGHVALASMQHTTSNTPDANAQCQAVCPVLTAENKRDDIDVKKDIDPEPGSASPYYVYFASLAYLVPVVLGVNLLGSLVRRPPDLVRLYGHYLS